MLASRCLLTRSAALIALAAGLTACGGRAAAIAPDPPGDSADRSPAGNADVPGAIGVPVPPATAVTPPKPAARGCTRDAECDDDPATGTGLGTCWLAEGTEAKEGACLCREGATMQPSGRCGLAPPPSCEEQPGATCRSWAACSGAKGHPGGARANADCSSVADGVCCVPEVACRPSILSYCYRKGTDAAYVPPCIHGWVTCHPGDSPDLQIR